MRCPECNGMVTLVVSTSWQRDGRAVRRRVCKACGHRWYSVQQPEQLITLDQLRWQRKRPVIKEEAS